MYKRPGSELKEENLSVVCEERECVVGVWMKRRREE